MKRHVFFITLIIAVAFFFIESTYYSGIVTLDRRLRPSHLKIDKSEVLVEAEILEESDDRLYIRVLEGPLQRKKLVIRFGRAGKPDTYSDASKVMVRLNINERQFQSAKNFGFDYDKYLYSEGYDGMYYSMGVEIVDRSFSLSKFRRNLREKISDRIDRHLGSGLLSALILGEKKDFGLYGQMQRLGISHLLVISGLHFSIMHAFVSRLTNMLGRKDLRFISSVSIMSLMLFIVGGSYSAQRAYFALIYAELARIRNKKVDILTQQSVSLLIILMLEPAAILSSSLHLSYYTYFSIAFLYRRLTKKSKSPVIETLKFSLYVQIVTLPILASMFGSFNLFSAVANTLCVPLFGVIVPAAFVLLLFAPIPLAGRLWGFLETLFETLVQASPLHTIRIGITGFSALLIAALIIMMGYAVKKLYRSRALACIALAVLLVPIPRPFFEISSLDVGHGDSTVVRIGDIAVLVDTGAGRADIAGAVAAMGIHRLDMVFITHAHDDHYGGLLKLCEKMEVGEIFMTEELLTIEGVEGLPNKRVVGAENRDKPICISLNKNGVTAEITVMRSVSKSDENDNGISIFIKAKKRGREPCFVSALFFGDASSAVAKRQLDELVGVSSDYLSAEHVFLKALHHGSATSAADFLALRNISWISASHSHKYKLPSEDFRRMAISANVHSTYYQGQMIYSERGIKFYLDREFDFEFVN